MRHCNQGRFRHQVQFLRRQFLQDGDLPFTDVLSEDLVAQTLTAVGMFWNDRIYTPLVTLWVFLSQVLSADHSCRAAVARLIAHLVSRGEKPCSAQTGAYCQARERLPEKFFADVACSVGRALDAKADQRWLWKGRRVYMFDGTTVSMPDTAANQEAYPQVYNQKPGLGFPIARLAARGKTLVLDLVAMPRLKIWMIGRVARSRSIKAHRATLSRSGMICRTSPSHQNNEITPPTSPWRPRGVPLPISLRISRLKLKPLTWISNRFKILSRSRRWSRLIPPVS